MTQRKIQYWVIPPQADAEFVAHMEQVLDLYLRFRSPSTSTVGACCCRTAAKCTAVVVLPIPPLYPVIVTIM